MNILIKEWFDNDCDVFVFDTSKVNPNIPFEQSYLDAINLALKDPHHSIEFSKCQHLPSINERYNTYADHSTCWKNLLVTNKPYQVDDEIIIYMTD